MDEPKKCRWKDRDGNWHDCDHSLTHDTDQYGHPTHCIFHAEKKDPQEFRNALARLIRKWRNEKAHEWKFSGFLFVDVKRERVDIWKHSGYNLFRRAVFPVFTEFHSATFSGDAEFHSATFSENVDFNSTVFIGSALFGETTFRGYAYFLNAVFEKYADFEEVRSISPLHYGKATFNRDSVFKNSIFDSFTSFDEVIFHGRVYFQAAMFTKASFYQATFNNDVYFHESTFAESVRFYATSFRGYLHFSEVKSGGSTDFSEADFSKKVYFMKTLFTGVAEFNNTSFTEEAIFNDVFFCEAARFVNSAFSGNVSFSLATFSGYAYFEGAVFSRTASFGSTKFNGGLNFINATFSEESPFVNTVFAVEAIFMNASFSTFGGFHECIIKGRLRWFWPGVGKKRDKEGKRIDRGVLRFTNLKFDEGAVLDLRHNSLQDDCNLEIHGCDMEHILLEGTDCTQIGFYNNEWPKTEDRILSLFGLKVGRDSIGDEYQIGRIEGYNPKPALIRRTYQQLARRFREDLDHPRANEFDRGSFEMRRLEAIQEMKGKDCERRFWRGASTYAGLLFYKNVSHYSGSLVMPLYLWLMMTIGCAFLYSELSYGSLLYSLVHWDVFNLDYAWQMFCLSFKSAISIVRTDVEVFNIQPSWGIVTLAATQKLISGVLLTLFIFAIRRRFKH